MNYSEMQWPYLKERYEQVVSDYIKAKPNSLDDSENVLRARLKGLGYRGAELESEVKLAIWQRMEYVSKR